jgi:hypothetical protein
MKCKQCNGTGHVWHKPDWPPPEEEESVVLQAIGVDINKEYKLEKECPKCAGNGKTKKGGNHAYSKIPILR